MVYSIKISKNTYISVCTPSVPKYKINFEIQFVDYKVTF